MNILSKWYCSNCNKVLPRWKIKKKRHDYGIATLISYMCLNCGSTNRVTTFQEALQGVVKDYNDKENAE